MNHLIILSSIIGGRTWVASQHHLWAYSQKDSPLFFSSPLKNCAVGSYLSIEPVIFQECVGHLSLARGIFQSHIPCGCRASQAIRENLAEQRMIISIGCYLPIEHAQMGTRISNAIILDQLGCLELGRHNDLGETLDRHFLRCQSPL